MIQKLSYVLFVFLIFICCDVSWKSKEDYKLITAENSGNLADMNAALNSGADINTRDIFGMNSLMIASSEGCLEIVRNLIEKGAKVNERSGHSGTTALCFATQKGHTDVVRLLIEKGADVNIKFEADPGSWSTALQIAKHFGRKDIAELLEKAGAK